MRIPLGLGIAMLCGVLLAVGLVVYQGAGQVLGSLAALGWGFVPILAIHAVQILCSAFGWRPLIPRPWPRPLGMLATVRWIREGINGLLPVAHIGGEVIAVRSLATLGVRGDIAGASVVLDVTGEVVGQVLFTLVGILLLALDGRGADSMGDLVAGMLVAAAAVGGFVAGQRFGLFKLAERMLQRLVKPSQWGSLGGFAGLHEAIQQLHRDRRALATSLAWHFLSWLLGTVEVWLALHFMGAPVEWHEALIIESLGQAARSAAFAVPGGVGVQEGGLMVIGAILGVPPEAALALAKRLRELTLGLPALAVWQYVEGRRLLRRRVQTSAGLGE